MPEPVKLTADDRERILEFLQRASGAVSGHSPTDKEKELLQELRKEVLAIPPSKGDELAARIALLDGANSWAQHFSTVRMAVTSFLTLTSLGIMQFRWDNPQPIHLWSSAVVWGLQMILLAWLTWNEYGKVHQIKQLTIEVAHGFPPMKDNLWPFKTLISCVKRRLDRLLSKEMRIRGVLTDVPFICFCILTVLYICAFQYWIPQAATPCTGQ